MNYIPKHLKEHWINIRSVIVAKTHEGSEAVNLVDKFYSVLIDVFKSNPTFKFAIGQEVWFLKNDKVQKGSVRVRQITESSEKLYAEHEYFSHDTESKLIIIYSLLYIFEIDDTWQIEECELFSSKSELLESL